MASVAEQALERIDILIEEAKAVPFSAKALFDVEELAKCVIEIRNHMPEEITQAKKITQERRDILDDASADAEKIIANARSIADQMVAEHQITKEAKEAAAYIMNQAKTNAEDTVKAAEEKAAKIERDAEEWAKGISVGAQKYVTNVINATCESLSRSLTDVTKAISDNSREMDKIKESAQKAINEFKYIEKPHHN